MTGRTHFIAGLCVGTYVASAAARDPASFIGLCCTGVIGGLLPDIDLPNSKAGMAAKPVSTVLSKVSRHRGMFHAPVLYAVAGLVMCYFFPEQLALTVALIGGCASHLLLDAMTVQGIPVLWPFKSRLSLFGVKTGGWFEKLTWFACVCWFGYMVYRQVRGV